MTAPRPYIGVTGIMTLDESKWLVDICSMSVSHSLRKFDIMIGVLLSSKTLRGEANKYPARYPKANNICDPFIPGDGILNLVHYSTDEKDTLLSQLYVARCFAGTNFHGFQLNIAWPDVYQVSNFRNKSGEWMYKYFRIVLQIGGRALEKVNHNAIQLCKGLKPYVEEEAITDILIDPSGGKGKPFDPELAKDLLGAVSSEYPYIGLGVAGGLCKETVGLLKPLVGLYGRSISVDAEGKLRFDNDQLDLCKAVDYIFAASEVLYRG